MANYTTKADVVLSVNGKQAEKVLKHLEKEADNLRKGIAKAAAEGDKATMKKLQRELNQTNKMIEQIKGSAAATDEVLRNLDKASPKELKKTLVQLQKELNGIERGSEAWDAHVEKIKAVKEEISRLNGELQPQQSLWDKFKNFINDGAASFAALGAAITGVVAAGKSAVEAYAAMQQEEANVRKYTGMSAEEVQRLNEEFKRIDTRTPREELNKFAQEAGRLGKSSQEDVLGYVRAADKINVALDDLGEGATLTLSKLTGIFGDEKRLGTEKSLLAVGSVINELSQNCSASAPYLAEFASRMGGVGAQAGMTIQQIMGFGAVLDANNQKVEASATAVSQVLTRMYQDPAKYAGPAGLEVSKFAKLLREDANGALLLLLETLNKAGGMDVLSPMFADMGESGARAIAALSTLAGHIDEVREQQANANVAFKQAVSIDQEFNVQNTTVQAGLDKARNKFNEMAVTLGEKLAPVMGHVYSSTSVLLRVMSVVVSYVMEHKTAILSLSAAIAAYNVAIHAAAIKTAALSAAQAVASTGAKALAAAQSLLSAAVYAVTGHTAKAAVAMRTFNTVVKANPAGLLVAGITALTTAILGYINNARKATKAQQELNDTIKANDAAMVAEQAEINSLFHTLRTLEEGTIGYERAKNRIIEQYGRYLKGLVSEEGKLLDIEAAYRRIAAAARDAAEARSLEAAQKLAADQLVKGMEEPLANIQRVLEENLIESEKKNVGAWMEMIRKDLSEKGDLSMDTAMDLKSALKKGIKGKNSAFGLISGYAGQVSGAYKEYESNVASMQTRYGSSTAAEFEGLSVDQLKRTRDDLKAQLDYNDAKEYELYLDGQLIKSYANRSHARLALSKIEEAISAKTAPQEQPQKPSAYVPQSGGGSGSAKSEDKFSAEKEWQQKEQWLSRAAYAAGQKDRIEHLERMAEIDVSYYKKILNRDDLTEQERLENEALYAEAKKKQQEQFSADSVERAEATNNALVAGLKQMYIDGLISTDTYQRKLQDYEIEHQKRLVNLSKEGSEERLKNEKKLADLLLAQKKKSKTEIEKVQQDIENRYFGGSEKKQKEQFELAMQVLESIRATELEKAGDDAEKRAEIEENYQEAKKGLAQQYGQEAEEDMRSELERYGDAVKEFFNSDLYKAISGAMSTLVSGMSSIFSGLTSMMQAELELQTASIEKRYDSELSHAEGNAYMEAQIERDKQNELAKAKNDANRKMFAMQIIQAVAQTAQNALAAYGSASATPIIGWILGPIAAAMAVAAGAIQIAAIKKQQQASEAQGYAEGGFTPDGDKYSPAGVVHAGEWVASQKLTRNPQIRPLLEALDAAQQSNTVGSLTPGAVSALLPPSAGAMSANTSAMQYAGSAISSASSSGSADMAETLDRLNRRLSEPFVTINTVTGDYGIEQAQDEYNTLMSNKSPKSSR